MRSTVPCIPEPIHVAPMHETMSKAPVSTGVVLASPCWNVTWLATPSSSARLAAAVRKIALISMPRPVNPELMGPSAEQLAFAACQVQHALARLEPADGTKGHQFLVSERIQDAMIRLSDLVLSK
jgi:hypothetical protein